jgi:glycosyltransferase involved in cell wall biosynthesis
MNPINKENIISVIIPCRNEKEYINETILSILNQKPDDYSIEILVVDGMSDDGTREILTGLISKYQNLRLIDNPALVTPAALNIGIRNSSGKYIAILGAHAEYADDYFQKNLGLIKMHPEVACTGGPIISKGKSNFGKAAAIAMSSSIGVGNANHRFPEYEGYAEMACFPFFKKDLFVKYGLYDESLIKNQDDEFCFRIRLNGEKIFISNIVKSTYYVRDSISRLFSQYYSYGKWRIPVLLKHKIPISYRQQVPSLFFVILFLVFIVSVVMKEVMFGLVLPAFYLLVLMAFALSKLKREKWVVVKNIPAAIFILHFSYAIGFLRGLFNFR